MFSPDLHGMTPAEKWLWICVLAYVSYKGETQFEIDLSYFSMQSGVKQKDIMSAIKKLEQKQCIVIHGNQRLPNGAPTNERTNERNEQTDIPASEMLDGFHVDFLKAWKEYPKKKDKQKSYLAWQKKIKPEDRDKFLQSCVSYFKECQMKATIPQYMQYMSTFINTGRWMDAHYEDVQESQAAQEAENDPFALIKEDEGAHDSP